VLAHLTPEEIRAFLARAAGVIVPGGHLALRFSNGRSSFTGGLFSTPLHTFSTALRLRPRPSRCRCAVFPRIGSAACPKDAIPVLRPSPTPDSPRRTPLFRRPATLP
jgi:hypothetical protein